MANCSWSHRMVVHIHIGLARSPTFRFPAGHWSGASKHCKSSYQIGYIVNCHITSGVRAVIHRSFHDPFRPHASNGIAAFFQQHIRYNPTSIQEELRRCELFTMSYLKSVSSLNEYDPWSVMREIILPTSSMHNSILTNIFWHVSRQGIVWYHMIWSGRLPYSTPAPIVPYHTFNFSYHSYVLPYHIWHNIFFYIWTVLSWPMYQCRNSPAFTFQLFWMKLFI